MSSLIQYVSSVGWCSIRKACQDSNDMSCKKIYMSWVFMSNICSSKMTAITSSIHLKDKDDYKSL